MQQMIKIDNLSPLEVDICNGLWACEDLEEIREYVLTLPTKWQRKRAHALYHVMIYESIDQEVDGSDLELAKQVLDKYL